jgi:hypothetical protein
MSPETSGLPVFQDAIPVNAIFMLPDLDPTDTLFLTHLFDGANGPNRRSIKEAAQRSGISERWAWHLKTTICGLLNIETVHPENAAPGPRRRNCYRFPPALVERLQTGKARNFPWRSDSNDVLMQRCDRKKIKGRARQLLALVNRFRNPETKQCNPKTETLEEYFFRPDPETRKDGGRSCVGRWTGRLLLKLIASGEIIVEKLGNYRLQGLEEELDAKFSATVAAFDRKHETPLQQMRRRERGEEYVTPPVHAPRTHLCFLSKPPHEYLCRDCNAPMYEFACPEHKASLQQTKDPPS